MMGEARFSWRRDAQADALYIDVCDVPVEHTEELSDGTVVDVGAQGELVGIEILSVSRGWSDSSLVGRFSSLSDHERALLMAVTHPPLVGVTQPHPVSHAATVESANAVADRVLLTNA